KKFINAANLNIFNNEHQLTEMKALFPSERRKEDGLGLIYRLTFNSPKEMEELLADYQDNPVVEYAEPDYRVKSFWSPNDPLYSSQWHFDAVNLEEAWDYDTASPKYGGDSDVVVAVIDTGVAYEDYGSYLQASDLASTNFTTGYDFVNLDNHPNDDQGHGTHVTGTIAQSTNNSIGVAGIAFNSTIMPIKVLDYDGLGWVSDIVLGIDYAVANGADVINMSLGTDADVSTLEQACVDAREAGVVVVAATGNDSANELSYPARYSDVIAVGATNGSNTKASYSNTGTGIDIVAPGGEGANLIIQQTCDNSPDCNSFDYYGFQGTSMATPHVAGAAALLLAYGVPADNVQDVLQDSTTDLGTNGYDTTYGHGLLDIEEAFNSITDDNTRPTNPSISAYTGQNKGTEFDPDTRYADVSPYFEWSGASDNVGVAGYYVYFGTNSNANPTTAGNYQTGTSYSASGLSGDEVSYHLKIKTKDLAGNVTNNSSAFTYIIDTEADAPDTLSSTLQSDGITISWDNNDSHAASYNLYRAGTSGGNYLKLNSETITDTQFLDDDVDTDDVRGSTYYYVVTTVDDLDNESDYSSELEATFYPPADIIIGPGPGGGPQVRIFEPDGTLISQFFAYSETFRGGINVAVGDLDNDGQNEIVTGTGPDGGPQVRVFDVNGNPKLTNGFFAYAEHVRNGVYVAVGDLNGDGYKEIITGTGAGSGPHVRTFDRFGNSVFSPGFFAYAEHVRNGVYVATGDLDGNGKDEIITGTGTGSGPHVRTFNYLGNSVFTPGFFPYDSNFRGGVRVGTADLDGNGKDEILTSPGTGGGPQVRAFDRFGNPRVTNGFFAFDSSFHGGIFLASGDTDQDGMDEIMVSVGGGGSPAIRVYDKTGSTILQSFYGLAQTFTGGINIASGAMN
ncbi:S8 family serine peptidase, partial [Patescibacteria group bacterium]|nr:S8 family serine peptidase [Patescibacteria group bacterium]